MGRKTPDSSSARNNGVSETYDYYHKNPNRYRYSRSYSRSPYSDKCRGRRTPSYGSRSPDYRRRRIVS